MSLFKLGAFVLSSGKTSDFKIDCDALTDEDWEALAALAAKRLPKFCAVVSVPTGGDRFADALAKHVADDPDGEGYHLPILIVDDVLTTGKSMMREAGAALSSFPDVIGVVVFARDAKAVPKWVTPLFVMTPEAEG